MNKDDFEAEFHRAIARGDNLFPAVVVLKDDTTIFCDNYNIVKMLPCISVGVDGALCYDVTLYMKGEIIARLSLLSVRRVVPFMRKR